MTPQVRKGTALILWGAYFDEVMATIFASALRTAGWRTKLVGLQGLTHAGRHGLTVVADLSLGQALQTATRVACVVAPCTPEILFTSMDPRIEDLLTRAREQQAVLIAEYTVASKHDVRWPRGTQVVKDEPEQMIGAVQALIEELNTIR